MGGNSEARERLDVPLTWHRVVFSYLGCPTAIIVVSFSILILVVSTLPLATIIGCWFNICDSVIVTVVSLFDTFPLIGLIPLGAVLVLVMPALSLLTRYGRILRGVTYTLIGAVMLIALLTYRVFYLTYTDYEFEWLIMNLGRISIGIYYPFYLILVAASVLILVGILEWLRSPVLLFRPYIPRPAGPPKVRMPSPVPEVALNCPQCGRQLPLEATFCDKCGKRITVGRPA